MMKINALPPLVALNKAFMKVKPLRRDFDKFKLALRDLLANINEAESEENNKNTLTKFLNEAFYNKRFAINTKDRTDLVIHAGPKPKDKAAVLVEVKRPVNKAEMISVSNVNVKAMQELVLYYLRERITHKNLEIKHLIATNVYEFFIFDAVDFEKIFAENKKLVTQFKAFENRELSITKTEAFYKDIASVFIDEYDENISCCRFDIREYAEYLESKDNDEKKLIPLFKILSPEHLLKLPFANDSNSLDNTFYNELLHIIGLTEVKSGGKKLIERKAQKDRDPASLIENACTIIDAEDRLENFEDSSVFGETPDEQLFGLALELSLTWINRVLFLKLLEGQLYRYHRYSPDYLFLNYKKINGYDALNKLFFQVLAKKTDERSPALSEHFGRIPYLNSSLFETTVLEKKSVTISNLDDDIELPLLSQTVLKIKNSGGKRLTGSMPALRYLFEFLDAYDFSSEGSPEVQDDDKTLINASVLGLIFEKINGYKDGSFFTPGFITMYMSRETIRRAVVQKFNEQYKAKLSNECENLVQVYNHQDRVCDKDYISEMNELVNSLKICDPAVGSGHFLVSSLNEIISIKSDLGILRDTDGKKLTDYEVHIENDELIVSDKHNGNIFEYHPDDPESGRLQEALFHEKQTIIENCLFGVDLNPNSVKICRLRLWIELLKNAYYKQGTNDMETLPNIDINIKQGNSLISRFPLETGLRQSNKSLSAIAQYKFNVSSYKDTHDKVAKAQFRKNIETIKKSFVSDISDDDPRQKVVRKLAEELHELNQEDLFGGSSALSKAELKKLDKKKADLAKKIEIKTNELKEIKSGAIYKDAFEWRFEFPEVIDDNGNFLGFDVVIGNPPYIQLQTLGAYATGLQAQNYTTFQRSGDIYCLFYEKGNSLIHNKGNLCFITSNKWMSAKYGQGLREFFIKKVKLHQLIDFGDSQIFDSATTYINILTFTKEKKKSIPEVWDLKPVYKNDITLEAMIKNSIPYTEIFTSESFLLLPEHLKKIKQKIETIGTPLRKWNINIYRGILTGFNEAFILNKEQKELLIAKCPKSGELIKPILRGRDIQRYQTDFPNLWLISTFPSLHIDINDYKEIKKYLERFMPKIKQTGEEFVDTTGKKQKTRKKTNNKWFETQDQIAYFKEFDKYKIIYPNMTKYRPFTYDENKYLSNDKSFILTGKRHDLKYLVALLNSWLFDFAFKDRFPELLGGTSELRKVFFEKLPIPKISEAAQAPFIALVETILSKKASDSSADTSQEEAKIDKLVYELYGLDEDEIAVVEGVE